MRLVTCVLLLTIALCSAEGCHRSSQEAPGKPQDRSAGGLETDLDSLRVLLSNRIGGQWTIAGHHLRGIKEDGQYFVVCVIPNPASSEVGRLEAQAVGYVWSSMQRVFGVSSSILLFSMSEAISPEMHLVLEAVGAQPVDPPVEFRAFVEENCNCRWNRERMTLERMNAQASEN